MMISSARLRYLRSSPQKVRLVVDQIRGLDVNLALATLDNSPKSVAVDVARLLRSAVANSAKGDQRVDADTLYVSGAWVDTGPTMKRIRPATFGRAFRVLHRLSHITIELDAREGAAPRLSRTKRRAQENREARKRGSRGESGAEPSGQAPRAPAPGHEHDHEHGHDHEHEQARGAAGRKKAAKKKPAAGRKKGGTPRAAGSGARKKRAKKKS